MTQNANSFSSEGTGYDLARPLLRKLLFRIEEQKALLAREIHNGLSQKLVELSLNASLLDNSLAAEKKERPAVGEMSRRMLRLVQNAIDCAVKLNGDLDPCVIQHFGLAAAMEWRATEFERKTKIRTRFAVIDADLRLSRPSGAQLHSAVGELLENISRHAQANEVEIKVWQEKNPHTAWVQISDDGSGMTELKWNDPGSLGLLEARERMAAVQGAIFFESGKNGGACFRICVPAAETSAGSFD